MKRIQLLPKDMNDATTKHSPLLSEPVFWFVEKGEGMTLNTHNERDGHFLQLGDLTSKHYAKGYLAEEFQDEPVFVYSP